MYRETLDAGVEVTAKVAATGAPNFNPVEW